MIIADHCATGKEAKRHRLKIQKGRCRMGLGIFLISFMLPSVIAFIWFFRSGKQIRDMPVLRTLPDQGCVIMGRISISGRVDKKRGSFYALMEKLKREAIPLRAEALVQLEERIENEERKLTAVAIRFN